MGNKILGLVFATVVGFSLSISAQQKVAHFGLASLESFQTTEAGEDEIYLVVSGRFKNAQEFKYRYPNATGHWDLNDGEGDPAVENQALIDFTLEDGQSVDLLVMVMEEDGGTSEGWTKLAGTAVGKVDKKAGAIIDIIGRLFIFRDSDDFIGGFSVHIENYKGEIYTQFEPRDRVYRSSDPSKYWLAFNVDMNGDGSNYLSQFYVR